MPQRVTVQLQVDIIIPDNAEARQYEGGGSGVEIIKPWAILESESEKKDLTHSELVARGIHLEQRDREIIAHSQFVEE